MMTLLIFLNLSFAAILEKDDRLLYHEVTDKTWLELSKSVGIIIGDETFSKEFHSFGTVKENGNEYILNAPSLMASLKNKHCIDLKYKELLRAGHCSAVMVDHKHALTAGHCLMSLYNHFYDTDIKFRLKSPTENWPYLKNLKIIINQFKVDDLYPAGKDVFKKENVFQIKRIVNFEDSLLKDDFALLEIEGDYRGPVSKISSQYQIGDDVLMIGHPLGLPLTFTKGQIENEYIFQFTTNLDSFEGASGAPVFHLKTKELIGLVSVGTGPSFNKNSVSNCIEYKVYKKGENYSTSITKASRIFSKIDLDELFMSTLSHSFELTVPFDIYTLDDFVDEINVLKTSKYSFYYEALMNFLNFNSLTSIYFLNEHHFKPDELSCLIYNQNRVNINRRIRNELDLIFNNCQR